MTDPTTQHPDPPTVKTIGSEPVARRLADKGLARLARIERLSVDEARAVLGYLAGFAPDEMDCAMAAVTERSERVEAQLGARS